LQAKRTAIVATAAALIEDNAIGVRRVVRAMDINAVTVTAVAARATLLAAMIGRAVRRTGQRVSR
jgi:hypothetical protein